MLKKLVQISKEIFSKGSKAKIVIVTIAIVGVVTTVTIMSMRKTLTVSIDGIDETFVTYKGTVRDVLQEKGIEVNSKDKLQPSIETRVSEKDLIKLKKAVPVEISSNGVQIEVLTAEDTVDEMLEKEKDILEEKGIEFDQSKDETSIPVDSKIEDGLKVQIVSVDVKEVVESEKINFNTVIEKDSSLEKSVKKVKSEGSDGEKEIRYLVTYKDGVEISREVKSTKIISEPKNKVVVEGTGTFYASRGSSTNEKIKKKLLCSATAYSGSGSTASGRRLNRDSNGISTIAVDPSVIPLGSKVYIEGYGYAVAADTGTSIKGNKIDVYFNEYDEACRWGLKKVNLSIVAYPGEW